MLVSRAPAWSKAVPQPTSGLDAANALTICRFLKTYAVRKNRTIIMSIHQPRPDIFNMLDRLMVLGGGQTVRRSPETTAGARPWARPAHPTAVRSRRRKAFLPVQLYYGPTAQAKHYFESLDLICPPDFNPADFILDVTMQERDRLQALARAFRASTYAQALNEELDRAHNLPPKALRGRADSVLSGVDDGGVSVQADRRILGTDPAAAAAAAAGGSSLSGSSSGNIHGSDAADLADADELDDADSQTALAGAAGQPSPRTMARFRTGSLRDSDHVSILTTTVASTLPPGYEDLYATSFWTQFAVLSGRSFSDMYRYPLLLRMHFLFGIVSGLLMGLIFFNLTLDFAGTQNRFGVLLFDLIVLAFGSMSSIGVRRGGPRTTRRLARRRG